MESQQPTVAALSEHKQQRIRNEPQMAQNKKRMTNSSSYGIEVYTMLKK
jgi:hypothetical protein